MIRPSRVRAVARFELLSAVKRPSYLIMTFGLPVFFALITGIPALLQSQMLTDEASKENRWDVVDRAGVIRLEETDVELDTVVFERVKGERSARKRLLAGQIEGYFIIPEDYVESGAVRLYVEPKASPVDVGRTAAERTLRRLLIHALLIGRVPDDVTERVRNPMDVESHHIEGDGKVTAAGGGLQTVSRLLAPLVLALLLMMALMTTSGYLVQAVAIEKENRVVEVLLAAVEPDEILAGKLLGLGGAGLLQFLIWSLMAVAGSLSLAGLLADLSVPLPWDAVLLAPVFFVLGYLFIGSLMLATGSLGNSVAEGQKLSLAWALLAMLPMLLLSVITHEPHGPVAQTLTWIPFTTPLAVILRMSADPGGVPWWEIVGALALLVGSTWVGIRLGARMFRVGLLLTGSRPSLRELMRQARLGRAGRGG